MEKDINCTVPEPQCYQSPWRGTPLDTSIYNSGKNYYYVISQVEGLNTAREEYAILLDENATSASNGEYVGYATIASNGGQYVHSIAKLSAPQSALLTNNRFKVGEDAFPMADGSTGFPTYYEQGKLIAANTQKSYFPSTDKVQLVSVEKTIGQSRIYASNGNQLSEIGTALSQDKQYLVWESQPTYDQKNKILFFASDRAGGYGGVDIWYMIDEGGNWSSPINCGENVNSACDDITPFVSSSEGQLYFSTQSRDNIGGYDIFKVQYGISNGKPTFKSLPVNLGSPLNTVYDEMAPSFPDYSDNFFYYSSDQDGDFDIYVKEKVFKKGKDSLRHKTPDKPNEEPDIVINDTPKADSITIDPTFTLEGVVKDNRTNKPIENIDVTVKKDNEDSVHKQTKTDKAGKYEFDLAKGHWYKVEVKNDTLFDDSYKVYVDKNDTSSAVKKDLALDVKKTVRINFKYDQSDEPYEYILDSLGNQINTTWQEAVESLADDIKKSLPLLEKVIITGHTDPVGSHQYNQNLGLRRAEFVLAKLVERGVPIYLLKAETKGETKKLVKFDNESESQYHKRLRRVTLEKIFIK
jgi:outer membrane protein OmpA-like peptidoglycan-associated protein